MTNMNYLELRKLLRPVVGDMKDRGPNNAIPALCESIGLPIPGDVGSKRDRMFASFDALRDEDLSTFGQGLIDRGFLAPSVRNALQDLLWCGTPTISINRRQRRDLARALDGLDSVFGSWDQMKALLHAVFAFQGTLSQIFGQGESEIEWIDRHFVRNPQDADVEALFEKLGVFTLSDHRFKCFLEGLVSADVQVDAAAQERIVAVCNGVLRAGGSELRQVDLQHGYPVYALMSLRSVHARPKTLIFASPEKPDIRMRDVLNNDVEVLSDPSMVLIYDRAINDGLSWGELQSWWADREGIENSRLAKEGLYTRLQSSLPSNSPPQRIFFRSFFKIFRHSVDVLPALLPEVWLHWDPVTARQRGRQAFPNHRMDFLMLLPGGRRLVFEIDGKQHYACGDKAEPREYAKLAAGTRELQLAGYEVYRFGGSELPLEGGPQLVERFFRTLFDVHQILPATRGT